MVNEVKNKVFFVTGAASGIGAEIVKQLVAEDAKFVVIFDVNERDGIPLQHSLNAKYGDKVQFIKGDVTNEEQFVGSLKAVKEARGLDVLINNAGIMNDSWETYKKAVEINVTALITGTLHAIKLMRKDEGGNGGAVLNISSIAGLMQSSAMPIYFATKSAVLQFSNCVGHDDYYNRTGVRVLALCFGRTDTALLHNIHNFDKSMEEEMVKEINFYPAQTAVSAAKGLVEAFNKGSSGSTWLINSEKPAEDISGKIRKAYGVMSEGLAD